jgi:hypothetical protein
VDGRNIPKKIKNYTAPRQQPWGGQWTIGGIDYIMGWYPRIYAGLESIKWLKAPAENTENKDFPLCLSLVEPALERGCCQQIRTAVGLILKGKIQKAAAFAVCWPQVQISRLLVELGKAIMGHRPAKYRRQTAQETCQLALWRAR